MYLHPELQGKTVPLEAAVSTIYSPDATKRIDEIFKTYEFEAFAAPCHGALWIDIFGTLRNDADSEGNYLRIIVRKRKATKWVYALAEPLPRMPAIGEFYSHKNDGLNVRERIFASILDGNYYIYTREVVEK